MLLSWRSAWSWTKQNSSEKADPSFTKEQKTKKICVEEYPEKYTEVIQNSLVQLKVIKRGKRVACWGLFIKYENGRHANNQRHAIHHSPILGDIRTRVNKHTNKAIKYYTLFTCNIPSVYKTLNHRVNCCKFNVCTDIEKNPGPSYNYNIDPSKTI